MAGSVITHTRPPRPRAAVRGHDIATYAARRDFTATAEPPPRAPAAGRTAPIFVVQKHAARRLHWDFRLEHDGVLWSWAVPKGPSLDPGDKRLAVHVEDHPLDYADFQGRIAAGQYGAGTVETWDRGTWRPVGDPAAGLRAGELKFTLAGGRLNGGFVLVRLKPRAEERAENWLLIKEHDDAEREGGDAAALEAKQARARKSLRTPEPSSEQAAPAEPRTHIASRIVHAKAPSRRSTPLSQTEAPPSPTVRTTPAARARGIIQGVTLTHPDRELWPGITKRDLADYWLAVADQALPEIAQRPLAMVRCPDGIGGAQFFQKHARDGFPEQIRGGEAGGAPFLAIDDAAGLIAAAQVGAIELHAWGATEADPLHPDRLVLDLDPGEGVGFAEVVRAAKDVRERVAAAGLAGFCRTSGGKGLHVVVPLLPRATWTEAREWCRDFARSMATDSPERYVAALPKQQRQGRILVDWLRNGLGATAVASFSPRARPGAGVATRLGWREVTEALDPSAFSLHTVPARLKRRRADPWDGFADAARPLPGKGTR